MALWESVLPVRGDDGDHPLRLQLRQFGGSDVVGDQDFAGNALGAVVAAVQRGMDAAHDLVDVVDAAAQVGIVHAGEHGGDAVALQAQGVVGGVAAGPDQRVQALQEFGVVEQQRVQVEELADFVRQRAVQALAQCVHFGADGVDRALQAGALGFDLRFAGCAPRRLPARGASAHGRGRARFRAMRRGP